MWIIRYFIHSIKSTSKIIKMRKESTLKVAIYLLIISLIGILPHNLRIIQEQGWKIDFVIESMKEIPDWYPNELPTDCESIGNLGLLCKSEQVYKYVHKEIEFVFNHQGIYQTDAKAIVFSKEKITYYDKERFLSTDYQGFSRQIKFTELKYNLPSESIQEFARGIEKSFSPYIILYSLVVNTFISLSMNILMLLLMGLVLQAFRYGFGHFMSYKEGITMLVFCMTIPSILGFIIGVLGAFSFTPVIIQFGLGIMAIIVIFKEGKKEFN